MSRKDRSISRETRKRKLEGRSRGDLLFGIGLFIVVVLVAFASVWYGLAPAGQQKQSQDQRTIHLYTLPPNDPTLSTCISQSSIVMRLKVNLRIIINSSEIRIPKNIGVTADCVRPVHTKDASGTVYVESPVNYPYTLKDLFAVWNQIFNKNQLFFLRANENHKIMMTVNGKPNLDYENHVLVDGEQIVITYT